MGRKLFEDELGRLSKRLQLLYSRDTKHQMWTIGYFDELTNHLMHSSVFCCHKDLGIADKYFIKTHSKSVKKSALIFSALEPFDRKHLFEHLVEID